MSALSEDEKRILVRWIVENVDAGMVPADEGNSEALIWNMVQYVLNGRDFERWKYGEHEEAVESWRNGKLPIE